MNTLAEWLGRLWPPLPVWRRLDLGVAAVMLYTLIVEVIVDRVRLSTPNWMGNISFVNAVLLGVLLAFRNKEAYERWWEARKLWGQLVNDARNLALKIKSLCQIQEEHRRTAAGHIYGFAVALKEHLWNRSHGTPSPTHQPAAVAADCYAMLRHWRQAGSISDFELLLLDLHARGMMDICGACERIQSSPVPLSYRSLLRHGTLLYLISAPWFMAGEFGYWSIAVVGLIGYFLLGIELTAESVEAPFGLDGDDLELARFCETIRLSVNEILDASLPMP